MKTTEMKVKTTDNKEGWAFGAVLPESIEEAIEIYGKELTFEVFSAGLDVKVQGIARNMFKAGKTREDVEAAVRDYKPGSAMRRSSKEEALDILTSPEFIELCNENAEAKTELRALFGQGKLREMISRFNELRGGEAAAE